LILSKCISIIFINRFYHLSIIHADVLIFEEENEQIARPIQTDFKFIMSFSFLINTHRRQAVYSDKKSNIYLFIKVA